MPDHTPLIDHSCCDWIDHTPPSPRADRWWSPEPFNSLVRDMRALEERLSKLAEDYRALRQSES